jgi:hypothetical protein
LYPPISIFGGSESRNSTSVRRLFPPWGMSCHDWPSSRPSR